VLLLFLDFVLDVKVFDVVLTEGYVDFFAKSGSGCFAEIMSQFWFLDETAFIFGEDFFFFNHCKSILVVMRRSWNLTLHHQKYTLVREYALNLYSLKIMPKGCFFVIFYNFVLSS